MIARNSPRFRLFAVVVGFTGLLLVGRAIFGEQSKPAARNVEAPVPKTPDKVSDREMPIQQLSAVAAVVLAADDQRKPTPEPEKKNTPQLERQTGDFKRRGGQLSNSFDAGDVYMTPNGKRKLLRLAGVIAIQVADEKEKPALLERLHSTDRSDGGYEMESEPGHGIIVLRASDVQRGRELADAKVHDETIKRMRAEPGVRTANPVFVDPAQGLRAIATEEITVRIKPGIDAKSYFGTRWPLVRSLPGTKDQFVELILGANAERILAETDLRMKDPALLWAEPNFLSEIVMHTMPNDLLYPQQWHLHNTGQGGGTSGADARVSQAWDITTGSNNIVIAVLDNGVQLNHPDLAANIFSNSGEIANGLDDDNDGRVDDLHGWDFRDGDNDPSPAIAEDNHGTAVAGVAAAVGQNNVGTAGVAFNCKILPIRVARNRSDFITDTDMATAIRYAAGLTSPQPWRGADVINMSFRSSSSSAFDTALTDAATLGRNGKGCAVFVASGNGASRWQTFSVSMSAGTKTFRWTYRKDGNTSVGADTAWLDSVTFPDGSVERFEGTSLPTGWTTGGDAPWTSVQDGENGNHAITGWSALPARSVRAGAILDNQQSYIEVTKASLPAGSLVFSAWVDSQWDEDVFKDRLQFFINGSFQRSTHEIDSGMPLPNNVAYPASHPDTIAVGASTDFDFRSHYSQYGSDLDFVAPSGGGASGIFTTDRTGTTGYNTAANGDYYSSFSGTSAACPLAAGIGALMLSVNPALTGMEIRTLMRDTCDPIGGVTYTNGTNSFYGYGRVNAQAAVAAVVNPPNTAPTISNIIDQSTNEDVALTVVAFTVGDAETAAGSLMVTGSSGNTSLVPNSNIGFGGTGANRTVTVTPAGNQNGTATITVTVSDSVLMASDTFVLTVTAVNDPPTISDIVNQTTNEDTATAAIGFTVGDVETAAGSLTLTGSSSNTALVPNANITLAGSGAARTVTVTPAANASGTATITVSVNDGTASTSDTFLLTVNAVNDAPTISDIANQTINEDTATAAIAYTVGDVETAAGSLTLTGSSSNTALVPNANITFSGSGASRTVKVTPAGDPIGAATITVMVSDGVLAASDSFVLTVNAVNDSPSFTKGTDQVVVNAAGMQTVANWATAISKGPANESGQVVNFIMSNDNNALFSVQPDIAANGTLSYTPAASADGVATVTVRIHDDGGTANGGVDRSAPQTFAIYVTPPGMLYVDLNYNGPNPIGSPIAPFPMVKTAVNAAVNGNTIRIFGGNYLETFINADVIQKVLFVERWEKPQSGTVFIGQ